MKALVCTGPEKLEILERDDPAPGPGELLVRVESAGICGSDMHAFLGHDERRPTPLILGHEIAGVLANGQRAGERVTVNPLVTCGACAACTSGRENLCPDRQIASMPPREGGFAELLAMPERNLLPVPDGVGPDAAALAEPLACGWHAVRLGLETLGAGSGAERILVIGGGAIGLAASLSLAARGLRDVVVLEPAPPRRSFLENRCGQNAVAPDELDPESLFDMVVDAVGYEATRAEASRRARPGGVIVHIGLGSAEGGLDVRRMTLHEIAFVGTYAYANQDFSETARAMFDGRLGPLDWTETRPLEAGSEAFADIRRGETAAPKIILKPAA